MPKNTDKKKHIQRVGIYETLEPNHIPTLNALIKSYSLIPNTKIFAFISQRILNKIEGLGLENLATLIVQREDQSNKDFLAQITHFIDSSPPNPSSPSNQTNLLSALERLHICSTQEKFKDFAEFNPKTLKELVLHIHNTDIWFKTKPKYHIDTLLYDLRNDQSNRKKINIIGRFLKNITLRNYYISKILKNYSRNYNLKLVVQNSNIAKSIPIPKEVLIFPFACYEPKEANTQGKDPQNPQNPKNGKKITIGICGMISQERRDYIGLFNALSKAGKRNIENLEFKLLGYINPREENTLLPRIKHLTSENFNITLCPQNHTCMDYQQNLKSCDILLNLVKIKKSAHSKYSYTKESGAVGDMISSGKPGLIPENYFIEKEFHDSTIKFSDLKDLISILNKLEDQPDILKSLEDEALKASLNFTPTKLSKILKFS